MRNDALNAQCTFDLPHMAETDLLKSVAFPGLIPAAFEGVQPIVFIQRSSVADELEIKGCVKIAQPEKCIPFVFSKGDVRLPMRRRPKTATKRDAGFSKALLKMFFSSSLPMKILSMVLCWL